MSTSVHRSLDELWRSNSIFNLWFYRSTQNKFSIACITVWFYHLGYQLVEEEGACRTSCPPGMFPDQVSIPFLTHEEIKSRQSQRSSLNLWTGGDTPASPPPTDHLLAFFRSDVSLRLFSLYRPLLKTDNTKCLYHILFQWNFLRLWVFLFWKNIFILYFLSRSLSFSITNVRMYL